MCLQKNPSQRPTINAILNVPLIKKHLKNILQDEILKEEFSNILLHNRDAFERLSNKKLLERGTGAGAAAENDSAQ